MKKWLWKVILGAFLLSFCSITANAAETENLPYVVSEGTIYHESSSQFGSGRNAVVEEDNPYTTIPQYVGVNGFSYLDKNGNIIISDYDETTNDISIPKPPKKAVKLLKQIKDNKTDLGWVDAEAVTGREKTKQKAKRKLKQEEKISSKTGEEPEEIVKKIQQNITGEEKTAIIVDFSGSMSDNQREVVDLLDTLKFNANTTIIVFATKFQIVTKEELKREEFSVGAKTHMFKALNKAISFGMNKLILISDLETYGDVKLSQSESLKRVIIYDPDNSENDDFVQRKLKKKWPSVTISRTRIK